MGNGLWFLVIKMSSLDILERKQLSSVSPCGGSEVGRVARSALCLVHTRKATRDKQASRQMEEDSTE